MECPPNQFGTGRVPDLGPRSGPARQAALVCMPSMPNFIPDRAKFADLARQGRLCFVYREWLADADTPVSLFAKLGRGPYSFLLESVVGGEKWAQYSFAGVRPRSVIRAKGKEVEVLRPDGADFVVGERVHVDNPLDYVATALGGLAARGPARAAALLRRRGRVPGLRHGSPFRATARARPRRARPARPVLRADRHRGGVRQPAGHAQGRGLGGRGGQGSRTWPTTRPAPRSRRFASA